MPSTEFHEMVVPFELKSGIWPQLCRVR